MLFDTFVSTIFICSLHVRFSSIVTPRNVVCVTCSMFVPFKTICTSVLGCFLLLNIIKFVLFTLSDNLFALNHRPSCFSSLLTTLVTSSMLLAD